MKVCTDSCLFGAWAANRIAEGMPPESILDIGTGTGLLALMAAQKNAAFITAVEIDANTCRQAAENFSLSPWKERLLAVEADIIQYAPESKFDWIISNPPFFENNLKGDHFTKNLAKHHDGLTLKKLLQALQRLLAKDGKFALLLPAHRVEELIDMAAHYSFYPEETVLLRQTPRHPFFRGMLLFSCLKGSIKQSEWIIKDENNQYSCPFKDLLSGYYLDGTLQ